MYSMLFESVPMRGVLKNPNELREAFLFEYLKKTGKDNINKFIVSQEAKVMVESGMIGQDLFDRLQTQIDKNDPMLMTTICHMAEENDDPRVKELFALRAQEREVMNSLMTDYIDSAKPRKDGYEKDFIGNGLPRVFKETDK